MKHQNIQENSSTEDEARMTYTSKSLIFKTLKSANPYLSRSGKSKTCDLCSGCSKLQNYQFLFKSDKERVSFATSIVYLLLLTHTKQLLLVTLCVKTVGSGDRFRTHGKRNTEAGRWNTEQRTWMDRQTWKSKQLFRCAKIELWQNN